MKRFKIIPIVLIILTVVLAACRKPQTFEPAPVITTTRAVSEKLTTVHGEFKVFNTQMGMSIDETQKAVNEDINLFLSNEGQYYFCLEKDGLDFVSKDYKSIVYFIFDFSNNLCEVQYETSRETGFDPDEAIKRFDELYGRHVNYKKDDKDNYIWYSKGDYILITMTSSGRNAITYFGEEYFKKYNPDEYNAYNN